MPTNALVISGGGSKGAFAVGALQHLFSLGIRFDIVTGTSTGALIAPLVAAYGRDALPTLVDEYTTVHTPDIIRPREPAAVIPFRSSIYESFPLQQRIERRLTPRVFADLSRSQTRLFLTTVEMESGELIYFQTGALVRPRAGRCLPITTHSTLIGATLASASIPVLMPPVRISDRTYVDGGVREYAPIAFAIDAGATDLYCVIHALEPSHKPASNSRFDRLANVATRSIDLLSEEGGENDLSLARTYTDGIRYLDAVRRQLIASGVSPAVIDQAFTTTQAPNPFAGMRAVRLHVIRPLRQLAGDTLEFHPDTARANLIYGRERAQTDLPRL